MATKVKLIADGVITPDQITLTTASTGTNTTAPATTAFVQQEISALVDSSPSALNTLNELADALGDDENFSTTVNASIAAKLPLAGGAISGSVNIGSYQGSVVNAPLDIKSDTNHFAISIEENSGTETWQLGVNADGDLNFYDSGDSTPIVTFSDSNNIGIGETDPDNKLDVNFSITGEGSQDGGIKIHNVRGYDNDIAPLYFGVHGGTRRTKAAIGLKRAGSYGIGSLIFALDSNGDDANVTFANDEKMRIDSNGNVGIGTSNPSEYLELSRTSGKIGWGMNGNYGVRIGYFDETNGVHGFHVDTKSAGTVTSKSRFVVRADSGNVGIGTKSPNKKLEIFGGGSESGILIKNDTNTNYRGIYLGALEADNAAYGKFHMSAQTGELNITAGASGYGGLLTIDTNGAERMRIDSSGNVGFGTSVIPTYWSGYVALQLGVDNSIFSNTATGVNSALFIGQNLHNDGSNYKYTGDQSNEGGLIDMRNGTFSFLNAPAGTGTATVKKRMTIISTGEVGIGTTPATHYSGYEALDIGDTLSLFSNNTSTNVSTLTNNGYLNSSLNWVRKYTDESTMYSQVHGDHRFSTAVSGSAGGAITWSEKVRIQAGGGISFNGDTSAANALDDYEEGTFSPTLANGSNATSLTLSEAGRYVKIGSLVHFECQVEGNINSASSEARFSLTLPFNTATTSPRAVGMFAFLRSGAYSDSRFSNGQVWQGTNTSSLIYVYIGSTQIPANGGFTGRLTFTYQSN